MSRVSSTGAGKTFFYRFDIQTGLNVIKNMFSPDVEGASHGDDLGYIFRSAMPGVPAPAPNSKEIGLLKKMVSVLTSFMISGDPNNDLLETTWEPSTSLPLKCLNMTADRFELIPFPENERFEVLDGIFRDAKVTIYDDGDVQSHKVRAASGKL